MTVTFKIKNPTEIKAMLRLDYLDGLQAVEQTVSGELSLDMHVLRNVLFWSFNNTARSFWGHLAFVSGQELIIPLVLKSQFSGAKWARMTQRRPILFLSIQPIHGSYFSCGGLRATAWGHMPLGSIRSGLLPPQGNKLQHCQVRNGSSELLGLFLSPWKHAAQCNSHRSAFINSSPTQQL